MEDLRLKTRMIAGGNMNDVPPSISYARFVSCETVRVSLIIAALNEMRVDTADIINVYIKDPCIENVYTILGAEFVPDERKMSNHCYSIARV